MDANVYVREKRRLGMLLFGSQIMLEANTILDKILSSNAKADLLMLFNENPKLEDRTEGIAKRIGKTAVQIDSDLQDLVEVGLLSRKKVRGSEIIRYDRRRAAAIRKILTSYITKALE